MSFESLTTALAHTVIGMGTVFMVLIIICAIIYLFKFIPKIQAMFEGKKKEEPAKAPEAPAVIETVPEEEMTDDLELVAVITAAIAASMGTSSDGFVVRSIRRTGAVRR